MNLLPHGPTVAQKLSVTRTAPHKTKRVKLRAREHARLQCQNLELDVMNLRQEIATLENLRQLLFSRTLNRPDDANGLGRFEKTIREYYALTKNGYFDIIWRPHKTGREPVDMVQFMHACFDASLSIGAETTPTPHGLDNYLGMMDQMMAVIDSPRVRLLKAHVRPGTTRHEVVVDTQTRCASFLTAILLDALFPHLQVSHAWLRAKLIGKKLVTIASGTFVFDKRSGFIVRLDLGIDQSASILKLAESLEELQILKGEEPWAAAVEVVDEGEDGEKAVDDHVLTRSTESMSPMSLRHVLSPERDLDEDSRHCTAIA